MEHAIKKIISQQNIRNHTNQGITICNIDSPTAGCSLAKTLLYQSIDKKTIFFLSGGKTPKELYTILAQEEKISPGAVGMIDERYGEKFHPQSNEIMIKETGLLQYLKWRDIPFYPILQANQKREETAEKYDQTIRSLFATFHTSAAILGIGSDGHTAGIPAKISNMQYQISNFSKTDLVMEYDHKEGFYRQRITMTFLGLSLLDVLLVLVFGEDKQQALDKMFGEGSLEEIPARFYKKPEIAAKTVIITDRNI